MKKSSFLSYIFAISIVVGSFLIAHSVSAVTRTVCASGCDHTTITAAEAAASAGDTIQIQTTYDRSTETFPVNTDVENLTFSCDSGATIGQSTPTGNNTFQLYTSSTVTGCTLSNINLYTASNVYRSGITITGNSVASNATGTIGLASQIHHLTISNNRDLDTIALEATSTDVTISGNTFYGDHALQQAGLLLSISGTSTQLSVTSNYFSSRFTTTPWGMSRPSLIVISSTGLTFSTNTVRYLETPPSSVSSTIGLSLGGGTHIFSGNKVETTPFTLGALSQCEGVILSPLNNMTQTIVARFHQNTFRNRCNLGKLLRVSDNEYSANIAFYVSSTNNIFDAAEQSTTEGAMTFDRTSGNTLIGTIDRNAVYGTFGTNRRNNGSADVEAGSNYYTINPH